jgi:hypothetical protein
MSNFDNPNYALYLAAINESFAKGVLKEMPAGRNFPPGLSLSDLVFWNANKLFHYPHLLHSIGSHAVGSWPNNAVTRSDTKQVSIFADSGGYQIGKGSLKGFKELEKLTEPNAIVQAWSSAHKVRNWIVSWSEGFSGYAMTLDIPLWVTSPAGANSPFAKCSAKQIIAMTVENLEYIKFYASGNTKWLNVVHGLDIKATEMWWNAVKEYKFSGWALAGGAGTRGGLYQTLYTTLMMRDDGAFDAGCEVVHVLGVSTLQWSVVLSALQQQLRQYSPNLRVTFDSSSPLQRASKYESACSTPALGTDESNWAIPVDNTIQDFRYVNGAHPFKYKESPIGQLMNMGHLNVRGNHNTDRHFDEVSRLLLTNHNVWVYLDSIRAANEAVTSDDKHELAPASLLEVLDIVNDVFHEQDWKAFLLRHKTTLDKFASSEYAASEKH